jgi:hypothetical protein
VADAKARKVSEWLLRKQALKLARAQLPRPQDLAGRAFDQARLLREVARQVSEPIEALPQGRQPAVLLGFYRDLVYWALVAQDTQRTEGTVVAPDLATLWRKTDGGRLLRAAGSTENLEALRKMLVELSPMSSLDAIDEDVARVRDFAEKLYRDLETPRRRVERILVQRWLHLAAIGVAVLTVVLAVRTIALGPNLARRRPFRTSSTVSECATGEGCSVAMFHTREENSPWVEFDLGGTNRIHQIEVRNRVDCCQDRAVPLIAEVSNDRVHWKEVARRDTAFSTWTAKFLPTIAAYVRLRSPRATYLHLDDVVIR